MSMNWAERVLQEQLIIQELEAVNHNIKLKFNTTNSRKVTFLYKIDEITIPMEILIPLQYPLEPPVVKTIGGVTRSHKTESGGTRYDNSFFDTVNKACLGILERVWHKNMGIAHYAKMIIKYITNEKYAIPIVLSEKDERK